MNEVEKICYECSMVEGELIPCLEHQVILDLQKEVALERERSKRLVEALRFYADKKSWVRDPASSQPYIWEFQPDDYPLDKPEMKAEEALREYEVTK